MFDVWIQHSDLRADETTTDAASEVIRMLFSFDWADEVAKQTQLENQGADNCPPGLGIVAKNQRILHICPGLIGALVFFHYPEPRKILGLFRTVRQATVTGEEVPRTRWSDLVEMFMSGNDDGVRSVLNSTPDESSQ